MKKKILIAIGLIMVIAVISITMPKLIKKDEEIKTFEIIFNSNGGTTVPIQIIKQGEKVVKPSDPTKEGYIFVEWLINEQPYDFSLDVTSDLTLSAKWIEKKNDVEEVIIKFDSAGGTTFSNQIIEKGGKVTKPSNPTREGYTFEGWYNGTTKYDFSKNVTSDITLTAKWKEVEVKYKVTFDSTGGSSVASQTVKKGNKVTKPTNPTREGYTFEGWYNGTTKYDFSKNVTSDIVLTAKWKLNKTEKKSYTVTFNSNGGNAIINQTIIEGQTAIKPTNPTREGYTFEGWYNGTTKFEFTEKITSNITLTAKWKQNEVKYTVTFNSNGGSSVASQTVTKGNKVTKPTNPTKNKYSFVEWTLNGNTYDFNSPITSNIELVATWKIIKPASPVLYMTEPLQYIDSTYKLRYQLNVLIDNVYNEENTPDGIIIYVNGDLSSRTFEIDMKYSDYYTNVSISYSNKIEGYEDVIKTNYKYRHAFKNIDLDIAYNYYSIYAQAYNIDENGNKVYSKSSNIPTQIGLPLLNIYESKKETTENGYKYYLGIKSDFAQPLYNSEGLYYILHEIKYNNDVPQISQIGIYELSEIASVTIENNQEKNYFAVIGWYNKSNVIQYTYGDLDEQNIFTINTSS